jgi:hypothetical protein
MKRHSLASTEVVSREAVYAAWKLLNSLRYMMFVIKMIRNA